MGAKGAETQGHQLYIVLVHPGTHEIQQQKEGFQEEEHSETEALRVYPADPPAPIPCGSSYPDTLQIILPPKFPNASWF